MTPEGRGQSPDREIRAIIRQHKPDLTDEQIDTLLGPLNEAGEALAEATSGRTQSLRQRVEALRDRFVEAGKPPDYSEFDRGVAAAYRDVARRLTEALTADDASGRTAPGAEGHPR